MPTDPFARVSGPKKGLPEHSGFGAEIPGAQGIGHTYPFGLRYLLSYPEPVN